MASSDAAGRRAYDNLEPVVEVFVEKTIGETRHMLRGEFTAALIGVSNKLTELAHTVTEGTLQSTREHAAVKSCIDELLNDVTELKALVPRVTDLETHERVDQARTSTQDAILMRLEQGRRWMIGTSIAVTAIVISAAGVLVAVLT